MLRPVHELNQLEQPAFAEALRPLFESAEPLTRALYATRPVSSYAVLVERAEWLAALNNAYEQRFGFRFVVFVHRRPRAEIVEVLRERLRNPRAAELRTGLSELFLIARDRLATFEQC